MKVCLAGTASSKELVYSNPLPKFMLESFYSLKEWQIPVIKQCELFLLDSGAFTFMNSFKGNVNWDEYIKKYADFINKYNIQYFFELDIDSIVGIKEVERLRNKLEKLTNKKCIPVWHKSRGLDYWKKICKEYDYVAIGGIVTKEIKPTEYKYFLPMLKIAKDNKCKVHGLGFTSMKKLEKFPFYSVDSTTWQEGSRFGVVHFFDGKIVQRIRNTDKKYRAIKTINEHNYPQWLKFQEYANKYL